MQSGTERNAAAAGEKSFQYFFASCRDKTWVGQASRESYLRTLGPPQARPTNTPDYHYYRLVYLPSFFDQGRKQTKVAPERPALRLSLFSCSKWVILAKNIFTKLLECP